VDVNASLTEDPAIVNKAAEADGRIAKVLCVPRKQSAKSRFPSSIYGPRFLNDGLPFAGQGEQQGSV
jgi:hypothetical protein